VGTTPKADREQILADFKAGRLRALTNANVLTTGFDYPDIDLIAMLRPTMSASLYVQMAGRGMRVKSHTDHCLVLDFAGVVQAHGPITAVQPPKKAGKGNGEAPVKVCDACNELVHISAKICPTCDTPFPEPEKPKLELHHDDIMGVDVQEMTVTEWRWRKHTSRASGKEMLAVSYYGGLSDPLVEEYFPVTHGGYAGEKAVATLGIIASSAGAQLRQGITLDGAAAVMNASRPPAGITYKRDGKYHRIIGRLWE
jgi:DNA repair protein RadD